MRHAATGTAKHRPLGEILSRPGAYPEGGGGSQGAATSPNQVKSSRSDDLSDKFFLKQVFF